LITLPSAAASRHAFAKAAGVIIASAECGLWLL
jgi:hypothetical protein